MNKYLTLTLAGLAVQTMAANVIVGTGFGVNASSEKLESHIGFVASAEHHNKLTPETGFFVGSTVYVSPAIIKDAAPLNAGLVLGGSFNTSLSPVSAQLGLSFNVVNSMDSSNYQVAPGVAFGGIYNLSDNWAMRTSSVVSFPTNLYGESEKAQITASIGVARIISMDA